MSDSPTIRNPLTNPQPRDVLVWDDGRRGTVVLRTSRRVWLMYDTGRSIRYDVSGWPEVVQGASVERVEATQ